MKTKHWIILFLSLAVLALAAQFFISRLSTEGAIATVYQDGTPIQSIPLTEVDEPYTITVTTESGKQNVIFVEPGQISVVSATCPDQICVHQGAISNSVRPIACLPNRLLIVISGAPETSVDVFTGG